MDYYNPDAFEQALLAVKKVLAAVADAVVPVQEPQYQDRKGRERKTGPDQYLNRIFSYLEQNSKSDRTLNDRSGDDLYLCKSRPPGRTSRGLYEPVSRDDVELAIIHMYLIVAEIAKIRKVDTIYLNTFTSKTV